VGGGRTRVLRQAQDERIEGMNQIAMTVAPMQERDLDEVLALEQVSFTEPWTRKMFLGELRGNAFATNLVARAGEAGYDHDIPARTLLGYVMFWVVFEEIHLMNLAVRPEVRRRGIAARLVQRVLWEGAARGAQVALLEVRASNTAAIALYHRLGFIIKDIRRGYYDHPREDAVIMVLEKGEDTMLSENPAILEVVRKEAPEFKTLEEAHQRLEAQLAELTKFHVLTPEEEMRKKQIQLKKLATKDKMAEIILVFKRTKPLTTGRS
jgi:ribosomal-protein-alanine N-acetyltransferase